MSTRTTLRPNPVVVNGSMAADITSAVTILGSLTKVGYALSWSGTSPVGTVSVQVSNDYSVTPGGIIAAAGTWNALPLESAGVVATTVAISGNNGNGFIDIDVHSAYAMRLVYTAGSGTGTLQAVITGKVS